MKPITRELRKKIKMYIKNGLDISDLIDGVIITGEDLSYAKIERIKRCKDNLSRCKFKNAIIGKEGVVNSITYCKLYETDFSDAVFKGKLFLRHCDARYSTFSGANAPNVEYQFTDFRGAKFCETLFRLGSAYGLKAKFDESLFQELTKFWNIEVKVKEEENGEK